MPSAAAGPPAASSQTRATAAGMPPAGSALPPQTPSRGGRPAPLPPGLPGWLFWGGVGGMAVGGVRLFVGRGVRTSAPPVAFGLAGGILGLLCTAKGWGYLFPYALLCLGMRANNPTMELDLAPFLLSALCYTVAFTALSVWLAQKRDAAAE